MALKPSTSLSGGLSMSDKRAWKLKEDCEMLKKNCVGDNVLKTSSSTVVKLSSGNVENFISAQAIAGLTRAAKKTVLGQQRVLMQGDPRLERQMKSQMMQRKRLRKLHGTALGHRTDVVSAPPTLGFAKGDGFTLYRNPPKIVVISASQDGGVADTVEVKSPTSQKITPIEEIPFEETPRSVTSFGTFTNTELFTPELNTPDSYFKHSRDTPRSAVSFTDWAWVRERLASRESNLARPESALTFTDFLDGLDPNSDEYDTDLEDNFVRYNLESEDRSGVCRYRKICKKKGIAPAKQILQKLSDEKSSLTLKHRYMNNKDTFALACALAENTLVRKLNLSSNSIDDEAAGPIFQMLKKNKSICRLDLSDNCLRADGPYNVSDMLKENSTLTHISVSQNKLTDKEALLLSEVLRCNCTLQALNVSQNKFSDLAGQSFAAALMDNDTLTSLDLSWNMLGRLSASALGKAIKVNTTLKSLDLSYNGFGDEGAALLGKPLRHNTTLKQLSLAVNHIGPFGVECLASGVCGGKGKRAKKSNCSLRSLVLDRNPLGRKGVVAFVKHMEVTEKLIDFSIKEVVLTADLLASIRHVISARSVSVFFEGQKEKERNDCAIQFGVIFLRQILQRNRITLADFFKSLDPESQGLKLKKLKLALRSLKFPPSELELQRLVQHIYISRNDVIHYKDIRKYKMDETAVKLVKESKPKKRIAFRF